MRLTAAALAVTLALASPIAAQTTAPADADIDRLRTALGDAYGRGDVEALLRYVHPEAVIVFPDGRTLRGPGDLRAYYDEMLRAPNRRVASYTSEPVVESRVVRGDVGLSHGRMNDRYVLTDGKRFGLDSRYTATLFRSPDGPPETGGWVIRSFHASTNAFDNEAVRQGVRGIVRWSALGGLAVGAVVGGIVGLLVGRRSGRGDHASCT